MARVKRGFKARRRRNRVLRHARGFYGARSRTYRSAIAQVHHAWMDAYKHRRQRKRVFRRLWIVRINAASRGAGTSYSRLMNALSKNRVALNRKVLADLALRRPEVFEALVQFQG